MNVIDKISKWNGMTVEEKDIWLSKNVFRYNHIKLHGTLLNLESAFQMEERIKELENKNKDRWHDYGVHLRIIIQPTIEYGCEAADLAHASPYQRCLAAYLMFFNDDKDDTGQDDNHERQNCFRDRQYPDEPCWGKVVVIKKETAGDDWWWIRACQGHLNCYCNINGKYRPATNKSTD